MKKRPLLYQKLHEGPVIVLQDYRKFDQVGFSVACPRLFLSSVVTAGKGGNPRCVSEMFSHMRHLAANCLVMQDYHLPLVWHNYAMIAR